MGFRLRKDVTACRIGNRLIFLDIEKNIYFRLPKPQESCLIAWLDGERKDEELLGKIGVITRSNEPGSIITTRPRCQASSSILEDSGLGTGVSLKLLMEVTLIVASTHLQLKRLSLKSNLIRIAEERLQRCCSRRAVYGSDGDLPRAAATFIRARRLVPINTTCLLDSMSMLRFLIRRRMYADLIIGVAADPFSAHCWLQHEETALNDTVGNVTAHTPIWIL